MLTIFTYQTFVKHGRDKQETSRYFLRGLEHIKLIIIKIHEYQKITKTCQIILHTYQIDRNEKSVKLSMTVETIFICLNIGQIGQGWIINEKIGHVHPLKARQAQGMSQGTYRRMVMEKFSTRVK